MMMFHLYSLVFCFLFFVLALSSHFGTCAGAMEGDDDNDQTGQQQQQNSRFSSSSSSSGSSNGCQFSINNGIISDGKGHSRRMTPAEEQQMANYHAQVARATEEFQQQMAQAVQAPFRGGFGIPSIGQTPQLRLPQLPCFRVDSSGGDGAQPSQNAAAQNFSGNAAGGVDEENDASVSIEE